MPAPPHGSEPAMVKAIVCMLGVKPGRPVLCSYGTAMPHASVLRLVRCARFSRLLRARDAAFRTVTYGPRKYDAAEIAESIAGPGCAKRQERRIDTTPIQIHRVADHGKSRQVNRDGREYTDCNGVCPADQAEDGDGQVNGGHPGRQDHEPSDAGRSQDEIQSAKLNPAWGILVGCGEAALDERRVDRQIDAIGA